MATETEVRAGEVVPIGRLKRGDIFVFDPAMADEDPSQEYVVMREGDVKVDITPIGTGLAFPPINTVFAGDTVRLITRVPEWMRPVSIRALAKGDMFVIPPPPGERVSTEDYWTVVTPAGAYPDKAKARSRAGRRWTVPWDEEVIRISPPEDAP